MRSDLPPLPWTQRSGAGMASYECSLLLPLFRAYYTWVKKEIAIIKHFRLEDSPAPSMPQAWPPEGMGTPAWPLFLISLFLNCPLVGPHPREKQIKLQLVLISVFQRRT